MGLYQGFCKLSGPFISGSCPETPSPSFCHCIHAKSPLWCRFLVSLEWVLVWTVLLSFCFPGSSTSSSFFWPFRPFSLEYFGLSPSKFRRSSYCVLRQCSAEFLYFLIWLCLILYEAPMISFLKLHQFLLKLLYQFLIKLSHILWNDFSHGGTWLILVGRTEYRDLGWNVKPVVAASLFCGPHLYKKFFMPYWLFLRTLCT